MKYEIIKGSEKDFEGAPEWAVYAVSGIATGKIYYLEGLNKGLMCINKLSGEESEIIAERRPITEQVWSGEGVPCVGQKVMTKSGEGIIDYVGSGVIVYSNNDGQWSVRCDSLDFSLSAIHSPEDVERDEAISEMVGIYFNHGIPEKPNREDYESMAALYDAGYRKME
jgi:predicted RNase H-like HicB family nuclease